MILEVNLMNCGEIFNALMKLNQGDGGITEGEAKELLTHGLIVGVDIQNGTQSNGKLVALQELAEKRKSLLMELSGTNMGLCQTDEDRRTLLASIDEQMKVARREILELSARSGPEDCVKLAGGQYVQITYLGRNVVQQIGSRLNRAANMEYSLFQAQLNELKESLNQRTTRAEELVRELSHSLKDMDEIAQRSVAVSLAYLPMECGEITKIYRMYVDELKNHVLSINLPTMCEILCLASFSRNGGFQVQKEVQEYRGLKEGIQRSQSGRCLATDAVDKMAGLIYSSRKDKFPEVLSLMDEIVLKDPRMTYSAQAVLALKCVGGNDFTGVYARYQGFIEAIGRKADGNATVAAVILPAAGGTSPEVVVPTPESDSERMDRETAAAILTSSDRPFEELINRYNVANKLLGNLFLNRMSTAAAMISVMSQDVTEIFENIRAASAQAMKAKISLSGLENFSLGLKLVNHTTSFNTNGRLSDVLGMAVLIPVAVGVPFVILHDVMVHQHAVGYTRFHPMHSHFVYG